MGGGYSTEEHSKIVSDINSSHEQELEYEKQKYTDLVNDYNKLVEKANAYSSTISQLQREKSDLQDIHFDIDDFALMYDFKNVKIDKYEIYICQVDTDLLNRNIIDLSKYLKYMNNQIWGTLLVNDKGKDYYVLILTLKRYSQNPITVNSDILKTLSEELDSYFAYHFQDIASVKVVNEADTVQQMDISWNGKKCNITYVGPKKVEKFDISEASPIIDILIIIMLVLILSLVVFRGVLLIVHDNPLKLFKKQLS